MNEIYVAKQRYLMRNGNKIDLKALEDNVATINLLKLHNYFEILMKYYIIISENKVVAVQKSQPQYRLKSGIITEKGVINNLTRENSRIVTHFLKDIPAIGSDYSDIVEKVEGLSTVGNTQVIYKGTEKIEKEKVIKVKLYQICFDQRTRSQCEEKFNIYENTVATNILENKVIVEISKNQKDFEGFDFVGTVSYAWTPKTNLNESKLKVGILERMSADVVNLYRPMNGRIFDLLSAHPSLNALFQKICPLVGIDFELTKRVTPFSYCNFWLAKPQYFVQWAQMIEKIIQIESENEEIRALFNANSNYRGNIKNKQRLREVFGHEYYTHHTFFFERFVNLFWQHLNLNVQNL